VQSGQIEEMRPRVCVTALFHKQYGANLCWHRFRDRRRMTLPYGALCLNGAFLREPYCLPAKSEAAGQL
jgi:hypothetical protein